MNEGHQGAKNGLHVPATDSLHPHRTQAERTVDTKLLEMLVCPLTRTALEFNREKNELVSRAARLAYPIRDAIPIMLASEARSLNDEELSAS